MYLGRDIASQDELWTVPEGHAKCCDALSASEVEYAGPIQGHVGGYPVADDVREVDVAYAYARILDWLYRPDGLG
jgi:hypothetical protein